MKIMKYTKMVRISVIGLVLKKVYLITKYLNPVTVDKMVI